MVNEIVISDNGDSVSRESSCDAALTSIDQSKNDDDADMNVYRTLRVSRYLPRLAGSAPFRLTNGTIKCSRFGQIWPLINLSIVGTLLYLYRDRVPYEFGEIKTFLITVTTWLQCSVATLGILKDALYQRTIVGVVRSIDEYDREIGYENERGNDKRLRFWSFVYSFGLVLSAIARFFAWSILDLDPASEIFLMEIDNSIFMFGMLTTLVGLRFRHLNSRLEKDRCDEKFTDPEYVRQLFTSLVTIVQTLGDHYSARLFFWTCLTILVLIAQSYYILTVRVSTIFVLATVVRLLPVVIGFVFFSVACQFTVQQINKTPMILLEKNIRQTGDSDRGRKERFTVSLYMALRPFEFSALGFFTVDVTLVSAVATVTVTYLTLCLQTGGPQSTA